jgi:hypothetical protein
MNCTSVFVKDALGRQLIDLHSCTDASRLLKAIIVV